MMHPDGRETLVAANTDHEELRTRRIDSLLFPEMNARGNNIRDGAIETCEWLLQCPEYIRWEESEPDSALGDIAAPSSLDGRANAGSAAGPPRMLWIKGKPGAGKSTLMRFAVKRARESYGDKAVLAHFFNARGVRLEQTVEGMYRTILYHLLAERPAEELSQLDWGDKGRLALSESSLLKWSTARLENLIKEAFRKLSGGPMVCFIDALDECNQDNVRDMIHLLQDLVRAPRSGNMLVRVCFASRYYPNITSDPQSCVELPIDRLRGHVGDIRRYVDKYLNIGTGEGVQTVKDELCVRAKGVFMWVVLVTKILSNEYDRGCRSLAGLRDRLGSLPPELNDLFTSITSGSEEGYAELALCMQWILFATQSLSPSQLRCGIDVGMGRPHCATDSHLDDKLAEQDKSYVLTVSRGLAETVSFMSSDSSSHLRVQVIHESVRDYMLKEKGLLKLLGNLLIEGNSPRIVAALSHDRLWRICWKCLQSETFGNRSPGPKGLRGSDHSPTHSGILGNADCPLWSYAQISFLRHANNAESIDPGSIDMLVVLASVKSVREHWIAHYGQWEETKWYLPRLTSSLLFGDEYFQLLPDDDLFFILTYQNLESLLRLHIGNEEAAGRPFPIGLLTSSGNGNKLEAETMWERFCNAMAQRELMARALLSQVCLSRKSSATKRHTLMALSNLYRERLHSDLVFPRHADGTLMEEPLIQLARANEDLAKFLLLSQLPERLDFLFEEFAAESTTFPGLVLFFLRRHVKISYTDGLPLNGPKLLLWAASRGFAGIFEVLTNFYKIPVNTENHLGRTSLHLSVRFGHASIFKILCNQESVSWNLQDHQSRTAVFCEENTVCDAMKLLVRKREVDLMMRDDRGSTPLHHAADWGHAEVVKLLLRSGRVDAGVKDRNGRTALRIARNRGYRNVVRLLEEFLERKELRARFR